MDENNSRNGWKIIIGNAHDREQQIKDDNRGQIKRNKE
jgi:hypothetical protein